MKHKMIKANKITYRSLDNKGETLDVTEHFLSLGNIRMGRILGAIYPERSFVIPEIQVDSAVKIIRKNGCEIVKIEDEFFMYDLTSQELKNEMDRIEKLVEPLKEFYHIEVFEKVIGRCCLIGVHLRLEPGWFYVFVENPTEIIKYDNSKSSKSSKSKEYNYPLYTLRSENGDVTICEGDTPCADILIRN